MKKIKSILAILMLMGMLMPIAFSADNETSVDDINVSVEMEDGNTLMMEELEEKELTCENLEAIRKRLSDLDKKIREHSKSANSDEIEIYKLNRQNIKESLDALEDRCIASQIKKDIKEKRDDFQQLKEERPVLAANLLCENLDQVREELKTIDEEIKNLNSSSFTDEEKEIYKQRREEAKEKLDSLEERCAEMKEDFDENESEIPKLRTEIKEKVEIQKELAKVRKKVIDDLKKERENFENKKEDLKEKHKKGNLNIEELRDFMLNAIESQLEKVEMYKQRVEDSNFSRKDIAIAELENVENKLNEYKTKVEEAQTKEELLKIGKEIKKDFETEMKKFAYFNSIVMSNGYEKVITKIESILNIVEEKYPGEYDSEIETINQMLDEVKLKIEELFDSIENFDSKNYGQAVSEYKHKNNEIRKDFKEIHKKLKDLKKKILGQYDEEDSQEDSEESNEDDEPTDESGDDESQNDQGNTDESTTPSNNETTTDQPKNTNTTNEETNTTVVTVDEAQQALTNAQTQINLAQETLDQAQTDGYNVDLYVSYLEDAIQDLALAQEQYDLGNYETSAQYSLSAENLAMQAMNIDYTTLETQTNTTGGVQ